MRPNRISAVWRLCCALLIGLALAGPARAREGDALAIEAMDGWYHLILELVRHTPTYSPPVAARAFGYLGVAGYESVASGHAEMHSMAGQMNDLPALPQREAGQPYDDATVLQATLATAAAALFENTGPTGQRAMAAMERQLQAKVTDGLDPATAARSTAYGAVVAAHILDWAAKDGGAKIDNMGFAQTYTPVDFPGHWRPTSKIVQQQAPLLPNWGSLRPFLLTDGAECGLDGPPAYSEDPASAFYAEAEEVAATTRNLTDEQRAIARFWSDDPMLSPTPPGHWISITRQIMNRDGMGLAQRLDITMRLGVGMADAFIGCWHQKFQHDLLRPVTYIQALMDPGFQPLLITPPFPEYPSGHSTVSGAAATVLTDVLGENFAFEDTTHVDDDLPARAFASFWQAAEEAGISRLYGGIHFRAAIVDGLTQGRCIGGKVAALKSLE